MTKKIINFDIEGGRARGNSPRGGGSIFRMVRLMSYSSENLALVRMLNSPTKKSRVNSNGHWTENWCIGQKLLSLTFIGPN